MVPITTNIEVWQRGTLPNIPPLLQPVAHTILQAREDPEIFLGHFPDTLLWQRPAGVALPGFYLQHLNGEPDRVFNYARGEALTEEQMQEL